MSNGGSGDFNLPFDASDTAKEVEKQTKVAQKMLRDMTSYEGLVKAAIASRKRIQNEMIRDAVSTVASALPPSVRRGQTSQLDPRTGLHSSLVMDPAQWNDRTVDVSPQARQAYANRPGVGGPDTFAGKFKEGLDRASVQLEKFASVTMMASGAALAIATTSAAISGYSNRGEQANRELGDIELLGGRAKRSLGMDPRKIRSLIGNTGDMAGASKFVESAIAMREQRQLTIPPEYVEMGLTAMRNGASADEVTGWLNTFQFHKLKQASEARPTDRRQAQELNRRQMSDVNLLLSQGRVSKEQRDFGAYGKVRDFDYAQDNPIISSIPGASQLGRVAYDLDPRSNPGLGNGGDLGPAPPQGPRGPAPIRQPQYDLQSGGRTGVIQVEIVGDRSRRPDPRTGNR